MKVPKIMTATFEESFRLEEDRIVNRFYTSAKQSETENQKERPILVSVIYACALLLLLGITKLAHFMLEHPDPDSPVSPPTINFLPMWLFWLCLSSSLVICSIARHKKSDSTKFYYTFINIIVYLSWLVIYINLFFLTFFLKELTWIGGTILFISVIFLGYLLIFSKKRSLESLMFSSEKDETSMDRLINKLISWAVKYGGVLVVAFFIFKFLFPGSTGVRTDFLGFLVIIAMWYVCDLIFIGMMVYLFMPYLLYGYYKAKYPEDYRKREGKAQLEWYGEKYFNKHIKGTVQEEQGN